jgi:hypothetical protein
VVVDESGRLHERVADGGAREGESAAPQIAAELARASRLGRDLTRRAAAVLDGASADRAPEICRKASVLTLDREEDARVPDGALDLAAVADDPRIPQETCYGGGREARDPTRVESCERPAVPAPPPEHGGPAKPRLRPFEDEELEQPPVGAERNTPLAVVVGDLGLAAGPVTAAGQRTQRQSV